MSTSDDEPIVNNSTKRRRRILKKPRVARACDFCRKRKIRCDGGQGPGGKCTSCAGANRECSYVQASKEGPSGYVEALEYRQDRMEALLKRLHSDEDFTSDIGIHLTRDNWMLDGALGGLEASEPSPFASSPGMHSGSSPSASSSAPRRTSTGPVPLHNPVAVLDESIPPDTKDDIMAANLDQLDQTFKSMHVASYIGKAGGPQAYKAAIDVAKDGSLLLSSAPPMKVLREKYWTLLPWERVAYEVKLTAYDFPDTDLLLRLVDAYFENVNILFPVLHRPTFEKELRIGLHLHQEAFGAVVLLVCANGARYIDDKRVLLENDEPDSWLSAGWKWYTQVGIARKLMISTSRLHDLQIYCLGCLYVGGASRTSVLWNMVGIGLRLAQEIGVHKKAVYSQTPTAENELFKRAFWVLFCIDRQISAALGRSCAIQEEDFDVDLPIDCDDEYWYPTDRSQAFQQPPDKPSRLSYFIYNIKLSRISGLIVRTVYGSMKARALFNHNGPDWEQQILSSFDSVFNKWVDSVPDHLRWNPTCEDATFFWQSAHLYTYYYQTQMHLHRPFIVKSHQEPYSFPSFAISINAARSCSHILGLACDRTPFRICPFLLERAIATGTVLMLGIWGAKRSGMTIIPEKEMEDVYKCMRVSTHNEKHWHHAGRLWDVLYSLVTAAEMPLPRLDNLRRKRRLEDDDNPPNAHNITGAIASTSSTSDRPISGSSRALASTARRTPSATVSFASESAIPTHALCDEVTATEYTLPTRMSDLGQMAANDPMLLSFNDSSFDLNLNLDFGTRSASNSSSHIPFVFGTGNESSSGSPEFGFMSTPESGIQDSFDSLLQGFGKEGSRLTRPSSSVQIESTTNEWDNFLSEMFKRIPAAETSVPLGSFL